MSCKIEGCKRLGMLCRGKRIFVKGYCGMHYSRFRNTGDANAVQFVIGESRKINPIYRVYIAMKQRCYRDKDKSYKNYGGRGIKVCDRWLGIYGFSNFCNDMGKRPTDKHSLDRFPDNNGDYSPDNCRWATLHQQRSNMRSNNKIVGVCFMKKDRKYYASLKVNSKVVLGKLFDKYEDAVKARKEAELKYNIKYE